jgi:hypothetical protein
MCNMMVKNRYYKEVFFINSLQIQNFYNHVKKELFKWFNEKGWFMDKMSILFDKLNILLWDYEYMVRRTIYVDGPIQTK